MTDAQAKTPSGEGSGLPFAIGAYFLWGLLPAYFKLLSHVPALEVVLYRVVWTVPLLLLIVLVRRQWRDVLTAFTHGPVFRNLILSATLIAVNWLCYLWALQAGHVLATAIGYYLNPLINVLLARLFLGERLRRMQGAAVAIAGAGVAVLAFTALDTLWISLFLAASFAFYGLVRKVTPVGAVPGLTVETTLMLPFAIVTLALASYLPTLFGANYVPAFGHDLGTSALLIFSGAMTAVPLLLFAVAARRMSYITIGFVQYIGPTMTFLFGLFLYEEPLSLTKLASFILIWISIAVFSHDAWKNRPNAKLAALP
jgi:chloramphenicol-sensitive protein RarD